MSAPTVTFDSLNINDGAKYGVLEGSYLGAPVVTFDEVRSYSGAVTQTNVSSANLIEVTIPLIVKGSSVSDLRSNINALNTKISGCTAASPKALVFDGVTYSIVASSQVAPPLTQSYQNKYIAFLDLVLNRTP